MSDRSIFFCLWVLVFSLLVIALFTHANPVTLEEINCFLVENAGILTSVGTVILVGLLTLLATYLANLASDIREENNRRIASEIKTSDFRQEWINALRDDLSQVVGLAGYITDCKERQEVVSRLKILDAKVRLRLHPEKIPEQTIKAMVQSVVDATEIQSSDLPALRDALADAGAVFIKDQWEDLKHRLAKARVGLEE